MFWQMLKIKIDEEKEDQGINEEARILLRGLCPGAQLEDIEDFGKKPTPKGTPKVTKNSTRKV